MKMIQSLNIDTVRISDQGQNSKLNQEVIVTFYDQDQRDAVKSYANRLAKCQGEAGLRLDVPPSLKGSFKILDDHGRALVQAYGRQVKRNIKFDDRNEDLMMDICLPGSQSWQNITIEYAREAIKIKAEIDKKIMRESGMMALPAQAIGKEKAIALMLALSPGRERSSGSCSSSGTHPREVVNLADLEHDEYYDATGNHANGRTSGGSQRTTEQDSSQ